jgi:hypothetical protein
MWLKRGALGSGLYTPFAFGDNSTGGTDVGAFARFSSDVLQFNEAHGGVDSFLLVTTQVFRDPSAWYHIVFAVDTTQATASNRIKIYVNGVQITAFTTATYPSLNFATSANLSGNTPKIGVIDVDSTAAGQYFDGYITEVNFIDGQQLTPSSFGSTNSTTGVWQPAKYTGTYGTNGFYLPFTDNSALTTSSNAGLGKDFSGNANYWVTNNISITAGATYDSMTDVPTLTSATAANYAVWNPNYKDTTANTTSTSNANLTTNGQFAFSSIGVTTDKFYFELTIGSANNQFVGVCASPYAGANLRAYNKDGTYYTGSGWISYGATYTTSDVIGVALDMTNQTIEFFKNNTSQGQKTSIGLSGQTIFPMIYVESSGGITVNFGQQPFAYTPPTGFIRLNTYNLPASTVPKGNLYFDVVLRNGSSSPYTTTIDMAQGALLWDKTRSVGGNNNLIDSVRGLPKNLESNNTNAEGNDPTWFTSFNNGSFTTGAGDYGSGTTIVDWIWKANGTGVSNTSGTITSSVSANTTSGFSVVTYTGTGANATVGHGLGVAPSMMITKKRSSTSDWGVYHTSIGNTNYLLLDTTAASAASSTYWNNTTPTSSVFSISTADAVNISTATYVAYCFAAIKGFSAFGSYTGNGSTDGPFVYTGFRPRWVLVKCSSDAESWIIVDSARNPTNDGTQARLFPDTTSADNTVAVFDFLSNGFKNTRGGAATPNVSGRTYIYMAFAQNPFANALAY